MKSNTFITNIKNGLTSFLNYVKKAKIELIILVGVFLLDLISKFIIQVTMTPGQSITVVPNLFSITYTINYYAAMGSFFGLENIIGKDAVRIILLIVTFISCIGFFIAMIKFKSGHILARLSFALIIGGALGNFYDRFFLSGVRDFLHIQYFGLDLPLIGTYFPIFNIADVALTGGVIIFAIYFLFMYNPEEKVNDTAVDSPQEKANDTAVDSPQEKANNTDIESPQEEKDNNTQDNKDSSNE